MKWPLVTLRIEAEEDVVAVRQRARSIAGQLGFALQDQTRIATAVSEIARNAYSYAGGGKAEFGVQETAGVQAFLVRVSDAGPGIADLASVLEGRYASPVGLGLGIAGARRLMDTFDLATKPGCTVVALGKRLPAGLAPFGSPAAAALARTLVDEGAVDARAAMREQNRELLRSLADLVEREDEARRLNHELAETNKGVVALYADLEAKADQLRIAGETLESTVVARTAELARSNALLKAEAEARERMGEDLRQAQKMEAVGQLTGGIAHDFNNLLTVIVGSLEMLRRRIEQKKPERLDHFIGIAMSAAERASALTHRLLAFARRQPLDPRPTEVNALIAGMDDLLRRTLSEATVLSVEPSPIPCAALCDAHQLENAILNLVINARDAMPDGGRLTLATSLVGASAVGGAGARVCIAVSDTGVGMPPEVVARAFEPFFTTKPLGQGTGLGLSMIYGFVRQSGGDVAIDSTVGRGTTIRIHLPLGVDMAPADEAASAARSAQPAAFAAKGRGERVLVVEDEDLLRDLVVETLVEAGYRVRAAIDGSTGLQQLLGAAAVDLLVTDVGLPGLNGRQMVDAVRLSRPNLPVLFMTGYAESAAAEGFLADDMAMITKPFTTEALLAKVRSIIDRSGGPANDRATVGSRIVREGRRS